MKNSKIGYWVFGCAFFVACGYWYITRARFTQENQRQLIGDTKIAPVDVESASVEMTKKQAYEERMKETAESKAKLDFVIENERPQKLAESVTRAMKSPYEKKLDEMKAARSTVPVYDGKPFSIESDNAQENQIETNAKPDPGKRILKSVVPKRQLEVSHEESESDQKLAEDTDVFNTFSINHASDKASSQRGEPKESPVIKAAVFGDQSVKAGGSMKFRLLELATIDGQKFERNTFFVGKCSFSQDRLLVVIDRMPIASGGFKKVELVVHDPYDLQEGLSAQSDQTKEAAVDGTTDGVEQIISSVGTPGMNIGRGVARIFRSAVNGTPRIRVPDGHQVILLTNAK